MMAELLERDQMYTPLWQQLGNNRNIHRLAGLSGALAVIFAAVGAHGSISDGHKEVFRNGNLMHFFHTIVLLAMPMARSPYLVSTHIIKTNCSFGNYKKCINFLNYDF